MLVSDKIISPVKCHFASAPDCQLNSPFEVKVSLAFFVGGGGYRLLLLGCRHPCHPPQATIINPAIVVTTPGWVVTCKFLCLNSSQHTPHKCQFFQITCLFRVGRTVLAMRVHEFYPY